MNSQNTKERPILFNGAMVRAIREGKKTQTRRPVALPDDASHAESTLSRMQDGYPEGTRPVFGHGEDPNAFSVVCPFGKVGDRLWVRETWRTDCVFDDLAPSQFTASDAVLYEADQDSSGSVPFDWGKKRTSIHMPRWASRILLEVVNIRVERVQDISEEGATAEGVNLPKDGNMAHGRHRVAFESLWDSLYQKGDNAWRKNPWVWVVEFKVVEQDGKEGA